jgi:hypothetical protein
MKTNVMNMPRTTLLVCLMGLGTLQCGGDEAPIPKAFEAISCVNPTQCANSVLAPLCADKLKARCVGPEGGKECLYPLKVATDGCLCIEEEARLCELEAGVLGVQICAVITSKPASTEWSDCLPLNQSE